MHTFVIVADDFTGANDTGVQLCKNGIPVDVILDSQQIKKNNNSLAIDTESRVIGEENAYQRVFTAVNSVLQTGGCQILYKKVDSTLRGHLQAEIKAAVDAYQPELIIFAPAYPAQGRTVEKGRVCVQGTPLLETEIAKDPRNPLQEDNIQQILAACLQQPITHYTREEVQAGRFNFSGYAYTFDTQSQQDLEQIAAAALRTQKKILWLGSAGLAEGLMRGTRRIKPVLAIVGSISSKTMAQLAYCQEKGILVVTLPMQKLYESQPSDDAVQAVVTALQAGNNVILTGAACRQDYEEFAAYGRKQGISTDELAEFTKQTLSQLVPKILQKATISGLFLTGGDTAIAVIQQLGASGSHIEQEIIPGFVQGRLLGGKYQNLPIVTKAGAFGSVEDIYHCIQKIKQLR